MTDFDKYPRSYKYMLTNFDMILISMTLGLACLTAAILMGCGVLYVCEKFDLLSKGW